MRLKTIGVLLLAGPLTPISTYSEALKGPTPISKAEIIKQAKGAALRHNLDPDLYLAILRVESSLRPSAFNAKTQDVGLAQVNKQTAKLWDLNFNRLKQDYKYNLEAGAIILADFKARYAHKEASLWVCRYNLGSKPLVGPRLEACRRYLTRLKAAGYK